MQYVVYRVPVAVKNEMTFAGIPDVFQRRTKVSGVRRNIFELV